MAKQYDFNEYEIFGDVTHIYIDRRNGERLTVIIDTEDLERVKNLNARWRIKDARNNKEYYAQTLKYIKCVNGRSKYESIYLHVFIMNSNYKNDELVNHINHNTLDNRKSNLEIINSKQNNRYRKGKNPNNKSGYRNVSWNKNRNKWVVQLMVENKNTVLGVFDDVHEAGEFADEMRKIHYGEFAGLGR